MNILGDQKGKPHGYFNGWTRIYRTWCRRTETPSHKPTINRDATSAVRPLNAVNRQLGNVYNDWRLYGTKKRNFMEPRHHLLGQLVKHNKLKNINIVGKLQKEEIFTELPNQIMFKRLCKELQIVHNGMYRGFLRVRHTLSAVNRCHGAVVHAYSE